MPHKTSDNEYIVHLWANSVPCLDKPKGSEPHEGTNVSREFFTEGNRPSVERLWSYSTVMAVKYDGLALVNANYYSVTTSKHQRWIKQSLTNYIEVECCEPRNHAAHIRNVKYLLGVAIDGNWFPAVLTYVKHFKVKVKKKDLDDNELWRLWRAEDKPAMVETIKAERAEARKEEGKRKAKETRENNAQSLRDFLTTLVVAKQTGMRPDSIKVSHWNRDYGSFGSQYQATRDVLGIKQSCNVDDVNAAIDAITAHPELSTVAEMSYPRLRDVLLPFVRRVGEHANDRGRQERLATNWKLTQKAFRDYVLEPGEFTLLTPDDLPAEEAAEFRRVATVIVNSESLEKCPFDFSTIDETHQTFARWKLWRRQRVRPAEARRQQAKERAKLAGQIEAWRNGDNVRLPYMTGGVMLRLLGGEIQTSMSVRFPVALARRIWPTIVAQDWDNIPDTLFHYPFDREATIASGGSEFVVGCHRIPMSEIEMMAEKLGLTEELAHTFGTCELMGSVDSLEVTS